MVSPGKLKRIQAPAAGSPLSGAPAGLGPLLLLLLALLVGQCCAKENHTAVIESIRSYDSCVVQTTFSYMKLFPNSKPPTSLDELRTICRYQSEGFKCIKEKTRGAPALIRRGLVAYVQSRQRHHKKYCADPDGEAARRFVADMKCNMEKRLEQHEQADEQFALTLVEIARRNYNDSTIELKYLCCAFMANRQDQIAAIGKECAETRDTIDELANSVIPNETNFICEDDEKLLKICPKLDRIVFPKGAKFVSKPGNSPSALALYLIATLGEPQQGSLTLGV